MVNRWRAALAVLAAMIPTVLAGCDRPPTLVVNTEPLLYLVLNHRVPAAQPPGQYALLLTTGSVVEPTYREATRFEMRRRRDGALFAWRTTGRTGRAPGDYSGIALVNANYHLPDASGPAGLGADSIIPGETYDLLIETEGALMRGSVVTPGRFALTIQPSNPARVVWPRVAGAQAYSVEVSGQTAPMLQTDTSLILPAGSETAFTIVVHALDPQLYQFQTNERLGRSGVDAGFGLFGAITTARLTTGKTSN